jgi:hypothetical protein
MYGTSFIPSMVAILVVIRTKSILNKFRNTGTTAAYTAKTLEDLGLRQSLIFMRFLRRSVIIQVSGNKYYLNEENLTEYRNERRRLLIPILLILLLLILLDLYFFKY